MTDFDHTSRDKPGTLPRVLFLNSALGSCFSLPLSRTEGLFLVDRLALPPAVPPPLSPPSVTGSRADEISRSFSGPQESSRQMVHSLRMCSALAGSVVNSNSMGGPEPSTLGGQGASVGGNIGAGL